MSGIPSSFLILTCRTGDDLKSCGYAFQLDAYACAFIIFGLERHVCPLCFCHRYHCVICYVSEFVQRFQFVPKDSLSTVRFVTVIVIPVSILERLDIVLSIPQSSSVPIDPFSLVLFSSLFDVLLLHTGPNNVRC